MRLNCISSLFVVHVPSMFWLLRKVECWCGVARALQDRELRHYGLTSIASLTKSSQSVSAMVTMTARSLNSQVSSISSQAKRQNQLSRKVCFPECGKAAPDPGDSVSSGTGKRLPVGPRGLPESHVHSASLGLSRSSDPCLSLPNCRFSDVLLTWLRHPHGAHVAALPTTYSAKLFRTSIPC